MQKKKLENLKTLDAKVKKPNKKLVKLSNVSPKREQDVSANQMERIELEKSIPWDPAKKMKITAQQVYICVIQYAFIVIT